MTLQISPPISMSDLAAEYNETTPYNLTDFYGKDGGPSSGNIQIRDFLGLTNENIQMPNGWSEGFNLSGQTAIAGFRFDSNGGIHKYINNVLNSWNSWSDLDPNAAGANYQILATHTGGVAIGGTFGTWIALSTSKLYTILRSSNGASSASMSVSIRKGTGAVLGTANYNLLVTIEP